MKFVLFATMASCAGASILKLKVPDLRKLDTWEEEAWEPMPHCNTAADCYGDDVHNNKYFCASAASSTPHHLRRRLFADFDHNHGDYQAPTEGCDADKIVNCFGGCTPANWPGDRVCDNDLNCVALNFDNGDCAGVPTYGGYCGSPKCLEDNESFYAFTASGAFDGEGRLGRIRDAGYCDDGTTDAWLDYAETHCDETTKSALQSQVSLACSFSVPCELLGPPTDEFCNECKDPLLDFLQNHQDDSEVAVGFVNMGCSCLGVDMEWLEDGTGFCDVLTTSSQECQDSIKILFTGELIREYGMTDAGAEDAWNANVGLCSSCDGLILLHRTREEEINFCQLHGAMEHTPQCYDYAMTMYTSWGGNRQDEGMSKEETDRLEASFGGIFAYMTGLCSCGEGVTFETLDWCSLETTPQECQDGVKSMIVSGCLTATDEYGHPYARSPEDCDAAYPDTLATYTNSCA